MDNKSKMLAYRAIDENVNDSTARQIIRYVMECELWAMDTINPSNDHLSKKYNWSNETTRVAISLAKKSQFITLTNQRKGSQKVGFLN